MILPLAGAMSPELLREIQMHLKPRHLAKLLQTCKCMNVFLGANNEYWTRVAAHLVLRNDIVSIGVKPNLCGPWPTESFFINMVNLPRGYKVAMDDFRVLIGEEMARVHDYGYGDADLERDFNGWQLFADAPLDVQVRVGMRTRLEWGEGVGYKCMADTLLCMREIAKMIAVEEASWPHQTLGKGFIHGHMGMVRFINDLDDDNTISIATKQRLMNGLMQAMTSEESLAALPGRRRGSTRTHTLPGEIVMGYARIMTGA